jgi:threonyl-tRNA synthetase
MKQIIKQNQTFEYYELNNQEAKEYLSLQGENYKLELLEELVSK